MVGKWVTQKVYTNQVASKTRVFGGIKYTRYSMTAPAIEGEYLDEQHRKIVKKRAKDARDEGNLVRVIRVYDRWVVYATPKPKG